MDEETMIGPARHQCPVELAGSSSSIGCGGGGGAGNCPGGAIMEGRKSSSSCSNSSASSGGNCNNTISNHDAFQPPLPPLPPLTGWRPAPEWEKKACDECVARRPEIGGRIHERAADGAESAAHSEPPTPTPPPPNNDAYRCSGARLTDGQPPTSSSGSGSCCCCRLSSGADLNCRHLIRSQTVASAAAVQHKIEYPLTRLPTTTTTKKQESSTSSEQGDAGASDRPSLFKRAGNGLRATKQLPPLANLPSLLTQRRATTNSCARIAKGGANKSGLIQVRTSLVEVGQCGSIKPQLPDNQPQNNLQRRLGKTIKNFVASAGGGGGGGSNWSRFDHQSSSKSAAVEVCPIKCQLAEEEARVDGSSGIKLERHAEADLQRESDPVVLLLPSQSHGLLLFEQTNQQQQQQQQKVLKQLLRNSLSCELSSLCTQKLSSSSTRLVADESNITTTTKTSEQIRQASVRIKATAKRKRRLSSVQKVKLQSVSIESFVCGGGGRNISMSTDSRKGASLANNKYIIEDKAFRSRLQRQVADEVNSSQSFFDERRKKSNDDAHNQYDHSCDFLLSMTNNNNNNNNYNSENISMKNRLSEDDSTRENRRANSNDLNINPPASSFVGIVREKAGGGDGRPPTAVNRVSSKNLEVPGMKERENWSMNIEFLLAVIGFAVDLGAFLIPYTIMFILGGLPIFYLEMSLGQYFSSGCLTVWRRVCPMAKGIGYAMCVLNFFTGLYYNTIISWAVFFFVESFTSVLPWTSCNNAWNTDNCRTIDQRQMLRSSAYNNSTGGGGSFNASSSTLATLESPTQQYFEREVLRIDLSTGINDLGSIRTPLAVYLAIVFVCIYFAIWKGVKSTGKAVWITALLPYFVLIPLLVRGVFLEGAWLGIRYYLEPQWEKIFDVDVWVEAAKQIYFSLGPGFGTLMALSSYNKFHHNCRRDAFIAAAVNYFASFIAGLVVFALLGYMATIMDVNINDVATEGPGLVFQVYPEGLATMRFSSMWSVLFFIMVITLGIDSTFGGLESVITGLCDEYPRVLRAHRGTFIGFLIVLIYFCSLPTTTYGGNYVIYLLESYGTSLSLIFIVLVETIVVCWIYGADRFCSNLEEMYGERPGPFWRICWKYISPTILLLIFLAACAQEFHKYHILINEEYVYPSWAPILGLMMTGSSVCCIPIYAIYYMTTKTTGTFWERLKIAGRPEDPEVVEKDIYEDAMIDKISDENDIHLNVVI